MKAVWTDPALVISPYRVALCLTEKQYVEELRALEIPKKLRSPFVLEGCGATTHTFDNLSGNPSVILVCLKGDPRQTLNQVHALIVHEATHVWQWVKKMLGEDEPSKEFEAYSLQSITRGLFDAYDEMTENK